MPPVLDAPFPAVATTTVQGALGDGSPIAQTGIAYDAFFKGGDVLKSLLVVVIAAVTVQMTHAQAFEYRRGDTVRLVPQENGDPLPDSRIVAVAGDHVRLDRSSLTVNGVAVQDVSRDLLQSVDKPWNQLVPEGHYFVVAERGTTNNVVRYYGMIPAKKIIRKL